ncbi:hypothetical protein [Amycolatopsis sp. FDAARGOS 1241]|uniref:hypothetical protein n=1 Tax=Amycolatopsis sp. FDAARGOS 1241 TaxID=2778070 RepID=UPI001951298A|nr:hypothetical protein [Amycolatopsis sp. FDAARGOS 1241]QRP47330.1 hypothetical protein I6J71_04905 [Amycolatopsis sp. FDAARGOS 1241]
MTNPGVYGPPKGLGQARIFMWIQVAFSVLGSILILALAAAASSNGAEGTGLLVVIAVINFVMAVALAVCAVKLPSGRQWPWVTAIVVEAIVVINGIVTLISEGVTGILPLIFAGLALRGLLHKDVRAWLTAQRGGQAPAV